MNGFFDLFSIRLGKPVEDFIKWLVVNYDSFFDGIKGGVLWVLLRLQNFMTWIPWFVVIALILYLGWKMISWKAGIVFSLMLFLIGAMGYWEAMMLTLAIVMAAVVISLVLGIPLGILAANKEGFNGVMTPVLDAMQTMPSFVYLIPAIMFFGLGAVPAVFATTIYSLPPVIRLTTLAILSVSPEMVEASESYGASFWQTLFKVELPQAMPTIMAGVNQTTMMAMAMVVISSMIGAGGLGYDVLVAINRTDIAKGFESGISIVFLAIIVDRLTQAVSRRFKQS